MKVFTGVVVILLFAGAAWGGDFTDNLNGTVSDNVTGLMWQQEDDNNTRNWEGAITYCEDLSLATHTDWRLPNVKELDSIVDRGRSRPAIDPVAFPNTKWPWHWSSQSSELYWTSTFEADSTNVAWRVDFTIGKIIYRSGEKMTDNLYARCVRGGQ